MKLPDGVGTVVGFVHLFAEGALGDTEALRWSAAMLEPADGGEAPPPQPGHAWTGVRGRKLRP
eukprot:15459898-Alexandrium_andersonii.AAC.1